MAFLADPATTPAHYRADIDGLRAWAVMAVVIFHAFAHTLKGGFTGVDIFFVISGYLISGIIFRELEQGQFRLSRFYARRIRRIFPALAVMLVTVLCFGYMALLADEYSQLGKHAAAGAGFVSNVILWQEAGYFDNDSATKPLLHLWSLGIEEQFYLLWPVLLTCCWRWWKKGLPLLLLGIFGVSFIANIVWLHDDPLASFYGPQARFWELAAGACIALLHRPSASDTGVARFFQRADRPFLRQAGAWMGLGLIVAGFLIINKKYPFPGWWALLPVAGACILIAVGHRAQANRWLLGNRVCVAIGRISFPLYLWHWPLLSFARIIVSADPSPTVRGFCVAASLLLAWATYAWVEKPIRFGAHRRGTIGALCVAMVLIGSIGFAIHAGDGWPKRATVASYPNNKNELRRTPATDAACLAYAGPAPVLFPYCRYRDAGAKNTVALIGDSHAHVLFPGLSDALATHQRNTVLMANSSCPPLLGAATGETVPDRRACSKRIAQMIDRVLAKPEIAEVFIVTRGTIYRSGDGFGPAEKDYGHKPIQASDGADMHLASSEIFDRGLARTVDTLHRGGKRVYYVLENPELGIDVSQCIARPLRNSAAPCRVELTTVLQRQSDYRATVARIPGLHMIDPLPLFCPANQCLALHDGILLYADDNHLSVSGSRFLAAEMLRHFTASDTTPIK